MTIDEVKQELSNMICAHMFLGDDPLDKSNPDRVIRTLNGDKLAKDVDALFAKIVKENR
jgi:hypothetical protein